MLWSGWQEIRWVEIRDLAMKDLGYPVKDFEFYPLQIKLKLPLSQNNLHTTQSTYTNLWVALF